MKNNLALTTKLPDISTSVLRGKKLFEKSYMPSFSIHMNYFQKLKKIHITLHFDPFDDLVLKCYLNSIHLSLLISC